MGDVNSPKVLDLFAGEGGASAGYISAGLSLLAAVDINKKMLARHPETGKTWRGDWLDGLKEFGEAADLIHASPPCQRYSVSTWRSHQAAHPDLVDDVRDALLETGKPFVIENVEHAPLENPVYLTGCMFGLDVMWQPVPGKRNAGLRWPHKMQQEEWEVRIGPVHFHLERKRGFEVHGFPLPQPEKDPLIHRLPVMPVVGGTPTGFWNQWMRASVPADIKRELMRTPWMSTQGVAEAIPPAYTKYIGEQFLLSRGLTSPSFADKLAWEAEAEEIPERA